MSENPASRSLIASLAWRGVGTMAIACFALSGGELLLNYWGLTAVSRWALGGIVAVDTAVYATVRVARRQPGQPDGPRRYTAVHPAGEGEHWTQRAWDVHIGATIPVRGLGPGEVPGLIVAATVAEDGRSVELTLDVAPARPLSADARDGGRPRRSR